MATLVSYVTWRVTVCPAASSSTVWSGYSGPTTIGEASRKPETTSLPSACNVSRPANSSVTTCGPVRSAR